MFFLTAAIFVLQQQDSATKDYTQQPVIDAEARITAARAGARDWRTVRGEPLRDRDARRAGPRARWVAVSDALILANSAYHAPKGYRFAKSAQADLDRDGRLDTVELVENGRGGALRITYGDRKKPFRIVGRGEGRWSGEGLYPAGRHAVMINYPESRLFFLFERGGTVFAEFVGD
jgi:hypothetical protein